MLRYTFPQQGPYVTIEPPSDKKLAQTEYLFGNEVRIPYLMSWNIMSMPPPNLVNLIMIYSLEKSNSSFTTNIFFENTFFTAI